MPAALQDRKNKTEAINWLMWQMGCVIFRSFCCSQVLSSNCLQYATTLLNCTAGVQGFGADAGTGEPLHEVCSGTCAVRHRPLHKRDAPALQGADDLTACCTDGPYMPVTWLQSAIEKSCRTAPQVLDTALSGKAFLVDNKFSIADIASYCWVVSAPCVVFILTMPAHISLRLRAPQRTALLCCSVTFGLRLSQPAVTPWRRWAIEGFEYDEFPNLKAWKERIDARPATQVIHLTRTLNR